MAYDYHCSECGKKVKKDSKFCYSCGEKLEQPTEHREEKQERVTHVHHHQKSSGSFLKILVILAIIVIAVVVILNMAEKGTFSSGGGVSRVIDPCQRTLDSCNTGCGEGILSSVCKEKCAYDYRKCKNG